MYSKDENRDSCTVKLRIGIYVQTRIGIDVQTRIGIDVQ